MFLCNNRKMCIPHAPTHSFKAEKRVKHTKPKATVSFNKKLLEPDPGFKDERAKVPEQKLTSQSFLATLPFIFT